jgi:hypothetical protein
LSDFGKLYSEAVDGKLSQEEILKLIHRLGAKTGFGLQFQKLDYSFKKKKGYKSNLKDYKSLAYYSKLIMMFSPSLKSIKKLILG